MIRLKDIHAENFRSLADVRLTDLPPVVLFYGENNTGKSNLLRAVSTFLRLASWFWGATSQDPDAPAPVIAYVGRTEQFDLGDGEQQKLAESLLGAPVDAQFRHDSHGKVTRAFLLEGRLSVDCAAGPLEMTLSVRASKKGRTLELKVEASATSFAGPVGRSGGGLSGAGRSGGTRVLPGEESEVSLAGGTPQEWTEWTEPPSPSDPLVAALRGELSGPWLWAHAERRFHDEILPSEAMSTAPQISETGDGLLWALFRSFASPDPAQRERFQRFSRLLASGPLPLGVPNPVLREHSALGLQIGGEFVTELGSGARQWALLAGMLVMTEAPIVLYEEPEANQSFRGQRVVADKLAALVADPSSRPDQLFATSHSPLTYALTGKGAWYGVSMEDGATRVVRHEDEDGLVLVFPEHPLPPPYAMRLYPGNVVWLRPGVVRQLAVEPGDLLQVIPGPVGEVRLMSDDRFNELAAPEEAEEGKEEP